LGLNENYPDGRTGNLPIIPFTRKNFAFAARTRLFYTVEMGIARRIFRIPATIFEDGCLARFARYRALYRVSWLLRRLAQFCARFFKNPAFFAFFYRSWSISYFFNQHK